MLNAFEITLLPFIPPNLVVVVVVLLLLLLVVVVVGRAVAGNPAVAAWLGRLRPKKRSKAGA